MIEIKVGEVYTAKRARSGESTRGAWQFVAVKEVDKNGKEGRKEITVWVENKPVSIDEGDTFRITKIHSLKFASRKDNAGNWYDEVNCSADIEPVMSAAGAVNKGIDVYPHSSTTFNQLEDDGELPF
jgi:hypothetical protein